MYRHKSKDLAEASRCTTVPSNLRIQVLVHNIPRILLFLRNLLCLGEVFFLSGCKTHFVHTAFYIARFTKRRHSEAAGSLLCPVCFFPRVPAHLVPPECVPRVFKPRLFLDLLFIFY